MTKNQCRKKFFMYIFRCSICGKQFSVRSNMKKHLKMHEKQNKNDENDFLQAFSHQVTFEVKENKHVCEFCGRYVFFREIALQLFKKSNSQFHVIY